MFVWLLHFKGFFFMLYFFISKMLGVDLSLRASTPTFIIEPFFTEISFPRFPDLRAIADRGLLAVSNDGSFYKVRYFIQLIELCLDGCKAVSYTHLRAHET